jgi:AraC family transcriptional regulator of adaptative response/methylated-DNA-[protein]-cysteine methyltransferase
MEVSGQMPDWLEAVVENFESDPARKWKDQDIRECGAEPKRVRRWFLTNHGITFHSFLRSRRLSTALARLSLGHDVITAAHDAGYESVSGFRTAFQNWFGCPAGAADSVNGCIQVNRLLSPLGPLVVASDDRQLCLLEFADRRMLETQFKRLASLTKRSIVPGENPIMEQTQTQLDEYFQGSRQKFALPLFMGGTDFQASVWAELLKIEFGKTRSYESIAQSLGKPGAQRAVGKANGDNRVAIVIPCHRVIRSNGELSGYGGGVRRKEWMLEHERAVSRQGQ